MVTRLVLIICLANSSHSSGAADRPGGFREDRRSLESYIEYPEGLPAGNYVLFCAGDLLENGRLRSVTCHSGTSQHEKLMRAIRRIAERAENMRLSPAQLDGKRARVWFNFSVLFAESGLVKVVPNHLLNATQYGFNYTSAQRGTRGHPFPSCGRTTLLIGRVEIDADGTARNANVAISDEVESDRCHESVRRVLEESRYIPAMADGKFVPSTYEEIFFSAHVVGR